MKVLYLHGWGGSKDSSTGRKLNKMINSKVDCKFDTVTLDLYQPHLVRNFVEQSLDEYDFIIANSTSCYITLRSISNRTHRAKILFINPLLDAEVLYKVDVDYDTVYKYRHMKLKVNMVLFDCSLTVFQSDRDELMDTELTNNMFDGRVEILDDYHKLRNEKSFEIITDKIIELEGKLSF